MNSSRRNSGLHPPHPSLLVAFPNCLPQVPTNSASPPPYTPAAPPPTPRPHHVLPVITEDEEWNYGFWGEKTPLNEKGVSVCEIEHDEDEEEEDLYDTLCFYSAVMVCILACFGAVFMLGLMGRYWNLGIGSPAWAGLWGEKPNVELQFCLANQNRQAPGPQTWRYINPRGQTLCTTERITLEVSADEAWKLLVDDEIDITGDYQGVSAPGHDKKFMQFEADRRLRDRRPIGQ